MDSSKKASLLAAQVGTAALTTASQLARGRLALMAKLAPGTGDFVEVAKLAEKVHTSFGSCKGI